MSPVPPLGSWWTDHLQLPGYDPIATAGPYGFDLPATEQALGFFTQILPHSLSPWEAAIVLNLWGWRLVHGQRRDAEPSPTVAPIAQAARQALAGEPVSVLPAVM
jgi:hypothetical protein